MKSRMQGLCRTTDHPTYPEIESDCLPLNRDSAQNGKGGGVLGSVTGGRITAAQAAQLAALEEEVVRNVEEAVASKVDEAMQSEEVQARIQVRVNLDMVSGCSDQLL